MNYQRFCLLADSVKVSDCNVWHYPLDVSGVKTLFSVVEGQLLQCDYLAQCGQIIDVALVPGLIRHLSNKDKAQLELRNIFSISGDWIEGEGRQEDRHATHSKKHGKVYLLQAEH